MPKMNTKEFLSTAHKHHCTHYRVLMDPHSQGSTTVTFHYDPTRGSTFVWLTATTQDGRPLVVPNGSCHLQRDWHISLFTDNARTVWDDLTARGWVLIAQGFLGMKTK
jgi:hypothetical protein